MKKRSIIIAAIAAAVAVAAGLAAVFFFSSGKPLFLLRVQTETSDGNNRLTLRFINEGKSPMVLATGELQAILGPAKDKPNLFYLYLGRTNEQFNGENRVVISPYDLRPVEVRPKEELRLNDITPLLTGLPAGKIQLLVVYEVSPSIGQRYGVWHGYIESNIIELNVARPETPPAQEETQPAP